MTASDVKPVSLGSMVGSGRSDVSFGSVVHVNEKGGCFGGTEEYIALLTGALRLRGVRSHLVCGVVAGAAAEVDSVHVVAGLASREPVAGTGAEVAEVVAALGADVVYLHNVFDPAVVAAVSGGTSGAVVLWYVHDHYLTCLSELRWRRDVGSCPAQLGHGCIAAIGAGRCVLRYRDVDHGVADLERHVAVSEALGMVDEVVVVSRYMRTLLRDAHPQLDARINHLSRPIRDLGALRSRRRTGGDPAVVTYAGRITPEKGLATVIEALCAVACDAPVELRIAGVIEDREYWADCLRLQAAAQVRNSTLTFQNLGHLDYVAMDELLRQSDVVTIPSQWPEPFGAVALEAMAAGAAVVASPVGGLRETVVHERNGLRADPRHVGEWAAALARLLRHPELARRLGAQGHRDAAGANVEGHVAVLDQLISDSAARKTRRSSRASSSEKWLDVEPNS